MRGYLSPERNIMSIMRDIRFSPQCCLRVIFTGILLSAGLENSHQHFIGTYHLHPQHRTVITLMRNVCCLPVNTALHRTRFESLLLRTLRLEGKNIKTQAWLKLQQCWSCPSASESSSGKRMKFCPLILLRLN